MDFIQFFSNRIIIINVALVYFYSIPTKRQHWNHLFNSWFLFQPINVKNREQPKLNIGSRDENFVRYRNRSASYYAPRIPQQYMSAISARWLYVGWGAVTFETNYGLMQQSPPEIKEKLLKALDKEYNVRFDHAYTLRGKSVLGSQVWLRRTFVSACECVARVLYLSLIYEIYYNIWPIILIKVTCNIWRIDGDKSFHSNDWKVLLFVTWKSSYGAVESAAYPWPTSQALIRGTALARWPLASDPVGSRPMKRQKCQILCFSCQMELHFYFTFHRLNLAIRRNPHYLSYFYD